MAYSKDDVRNAVEEYASGASMRCRASLFHGTERTGTDDTVHRRAIQRNALTKYQASNAFERSPRPSNSSTILLKKESTPSEPIKEQQIPNSVFRGEETESLAG